MLISSSMPNSLTLTFLLFLIPFVYNLNYVVRYYKKLFISYNMLPSVKAIKPNYFKRSIMACNFWF